MSKTQTSTRRLRGATTPPRISTLVLLAGTSVMSMNIFLPMLPAIGTDLNVPPSVAQYVLTIFLAATAVVQLFVGPLSDRFGRRPVLLCSLLIFLVATLVCIFAPTIEILLFGRVLQAASATSMVLSRAIIRDLFSRSKAASMIGYVTMAMAVIPMVTPTVGGYVGAYYGWRATFVVLFVVVAILFALIYFDLGETHTPRRNSLSEQVSDYITLLKEPSIWGYILCATFGSGAYFAFLGGAPFVGSDIIGMSSTDLGFYFGFVALGYMAGNFVSGRYSEKIGIEPMMFYGGIIACIGVGMALLLMSNFDPKAGYLFYPMMLVGMGNGMMLPNANAGTVSVRPDLAGSASGLSGFLTIGGGAALASLSGSLITSENQALPLYVIMFSSSLLGAGIAAMMYFKARKEAV
ncbi:MAG: multidrug effflux MFS transporter [Rhizobiaceae bacterium]